MKVVHAVVPTEEPVTIAAKESITRQELRLSVVRCDGERKVNLSLWDVEETGASPRGGGYTISFADAKKLRDALNQVLENA